MELNFIFIFTNCLLFNYFNPLHCQTAQCPVNEIYHKNPSPLCDVNCQNLQRRCPLTSERPVAGCYCKPNYARSLQQGCIRQQECARDCARNESPIAPLLSGCEKICPTSSTGLSIRICYRIQERSCVCSKQYCRNRRAQCV